MASIDDQLKAYWASIEAQALRPTIDEEKLLKAINKYGRGYFVGEVFKRTGKQPPSPDMTKEQWMEAHANARRCAREIAKDLAEDVAKGEDVTELRHQYWMFFGEAIHCAALGGNEVPLLPSPWALPEHMTRIRDRLGEMSDQADALVKAWADSAQA